MGAGSNQVYVDGKKEGIIPDFKAAQGKVEPFVGVVEPGQIAYGVDLVPFSEFTCDRQDYDTHIMGNNNADFDCKLFWDDATDSTGDERHLLSRTVGRTFFDENGTDLIVLSVSYSGMSKDREDREAADGGN